MEGSEEGREGGREGGREERTCPGALTGLDDDVGPFAHTHKVLVFVKDTKQEGGREGGREGEYGCL